MFINFLPASLQQENEKTGSIIGPGKTAEIESNEKTHCQHRYIFVIKNSISFHHFCFSNSRRGYFEISHTQ